MLLVNRLTHGATIAALVAALLIVSCATVPGRNGHVEEAAWYRALNIASATAEEREAWRIPTTKIYNFPLYFILVDKRPLRLCGMEDNYYTEGAKIVQLVTAAVRPREDALLLDVLTHEYLHAIWFNRAFANDLWHRQNPDGELWINVIFQGQAECPAE